MAEVEKWFLARGLPHFIDSYSASRDVLTRALPVLTLILLVELSLALKLSWPPWANVTVIAVGFAGLLAVWAVVNRLRRRPALARADRVGAPEAAVFVLVPSLLPLAAGGQWLTSFNTFAGTPAEPLAVDLPDDCATAAADMSRRPVALTTELLTVATLLAVVAGFSFTLSLLTDDTYRREFLQDLLGEVRQAFAVRATYLHAVSHA